MNDELNPSTDVPSKSQLKREMSALQKMGAKLTTFNDNQLSQLPLSDKLRQAIAEYNRLPNSHEAKRRQLQFIGRLMRDHDLETLQGAIDRVLQPMNPKAVVADNTSEACSKILNEGDPGINSLLQTHQYLERTVLRKFHLQSKRIDEIEYPQQLDQLKRRLVKYLKKNM